MALLLGIDTGGTYTDAVLINDKGSIIQSAKALTTQYDLSVGIKQAIRFVVQDSKKEIKLVSLSTTLATNSIIEGQGSPICLLVIGYDPMLLKDLGLEKILAQEAIEFIPGGHTVNGEEQAPIDIEGAKKAILAHAPSVAAFAVSGYFSVRNPSHELIVKGLIQNLTDLPVTCGHELTSNLNAPRRAITVALNARIIPLIQQLIFAVQKTMKEENIRAPLMVVKGDGSLIEAQMAMERPVETILSGPAASVVGARYLTDNDECYVIDMGGTTTDIAVFRNGKPKLSAKGAVIGGWETMIEAIQVYTSGIGGDSEVFLDEKGTVSVGPRRAVPLNLLAQQYPEIVNTLRNQNNVYKEKDLSNFNEDIGRFIMRQREGLASQKKFTSIQNEIWQLLENEPLALADFIKRVKYPLLYKKSLYELMDRGLIINGAFTPTDALHVLGCYNNGSVEAAELGARLWSNQLDMSINSLCEWVVSHVSIKIGQALINSELIAEGITLKNDDKAGRLFMDRILRNSDRHSFSVSIALKNPIVAIGAPVKSYLPWVGSKLNTDLYIPEHAEVGNAIGAASGSVIQSVKILIRPMDNGKIYRAYLPLEVRDFQTLTDAIVCAKDIACRLAKDHACLAGAKMPQVHVEQNDRILKDGGKGLEEVYIETEVTATAVGRPQAGI